MSAEEAATAIRGNREDPMNSTLEGTDVMVREIPFRADGEVQN